MISLNPHIRPALTSENLPPVARDLKKRFQTPELGVNFPLHSEELDAILGQYQRIEELYDQFKGCSLIELQRRVIEDQSISVEEIIAIGKHALQKRFKILPYDTQIFTLLGILSTPAEAKGRLAQVKTGEGKSTIITLMALVLAVKGKSVDIISSSHYLAMRDQQKYESFFKGFEITTAHICDSQQTPEAFEADILYGMVVDFEFALMRQTIQTQAIFSSLRNNFNSVIVDEVDNLLIDISMNSARIAQPSIDSYRSVYEPIFEFVKQGYSPLHLREYISNRGIENINEEQLQTYYHSARIALAKKQNIDYVLKESPDSQNKMLIQIIDKENTGRLCEGLRWGQGVHEFLEIKHELLPEKETITPISISHAVFYDTYKGKIFGLSGTLGSRQEREELRAIYNLEHFDSPVHHSFKRIDHPPEICFSQQEYNHTLISKIRKKHDKNRPVLILCPSIKKSQELYTLCKSSQIPCQLFNEMQSDSPEDIIGNAGFPGHVTITTNNAGRGTDIRLYEESLKAGGLHVILTFYPYSQRVEEQALGRGGRQGDNGSSEILLLAQTLQKQGIPIQKSNDRGFEYLTVQEIAKTASVSKKWRNRAQAHPLLMLRSYREKSIEKQVATHVKRAQSERMIAQFSKRFWGSLKVWRKNVATPSFFERMQKNVEEGKEQDKTQWDCAREVSHLETEAIQRWVKHFYRPSEKLIIQEEDIEMIPKLFDSQKHHWEALFDDSQLVEAL